MTIDLYIHWIININKKFSIKELIYKFKIHFVKNDKKNECGTTWSHICYKNFIAVQKQNNDETKQKQMLKNSYKKYIAKTRSKN